MKERRGYLRLRTGKIVNHLFEARNTLTQRTEGPRCKGIVRIDISHMQEGDHAGLFSFCSEPGGIRIVKNSSDYTLEMLDRDRICAQAPYSSNEIWLCMSCDFTTDIATFSYSQDGEHYTPLGGGFHMIFSMAHFTGNKFAIFNYATKQSGGYIDIDSFEYSK